MAVKKVEIDLDEFEVDEIIEHLEYVHLTKSEVIQILGVVLKNSEKLKGTELHELEEILDLEFDPEWPEVNSLADKYKRQAVVENWERLSQTDFEARLSA